MDLCEHLQGGNGTFNLSPTTAADVQRDVRRAHCTTCGKPVVIPRSMLKTAHNGRTIELVTPAAPVARR